jgi:dolichol-phosphate mannosyltransferase
MDADWSHDPALPAGLVWPRWTAPRGRPGHRLALRGRRRRAQLGLLRRLVSRGGSIFARIVLGLPAARPDRRLQGLAARYAGGDCPWDRLHSGGYVFQIETTYLASRARRARDRGTDRLRGPPRWASSKMSRRIIVEALAVVLRLRWERAARARRRLGRG